ncbi:polar amino acid transport system substrate-binding protein [Inhella inkyongensis]|uniref:Polar amino acid transport system substrate-binding protein n=1 Tax=Inhella inkyongensis TaxID=392593 RepID=A0A840S9H3_9BURK|nr:transporter substrate-binding domain-containing protein [Inhella inkyongensis]MBB5206178.1 polar amino acid transport system substrate-binding protein [Inhella inkyongensis]
MKIWQVTGWIAWGLLGACGAAWVQAQPGPTGATASCKTLKASGNPQYPPYLWPDPVQEGQLVGANADLMAWLGKELGVTIEVRHVGSWGRVQEEMRAGRLDLIAGAFFTLPRTEYMDYVHPPFRETRSVVLVREAKPFDYQRWTDLVPRAGLTVINNSFGEAFDRFAADKLRISKTPTLEQAMGMLALGRADYLLYEDSPAEAYMARMNVRGVKLLSPPVAQEQLYVTLSHRSECNTPELRGALARAMFKLQREKLMPDFVRAGVLRWQKEGAAVSAAPNKP